jgi:PncC family amidohydrolase
MRLSGYTLRLPSLSGRRLYRKMPAVTTRTTQRDLDRLARDLARALREQSRRIVFAESCTGGLVSAVLTGVPGVSEHHCGSAVVYRLATKSEWLEIEPSLLDDPGPVSAAVAAKMAAGVLKRTPEADLAISVTGHLGPDAPPELDGVVYIGIARQPGAGEQVTPSTRRFQLSGGNTPARQRSRTQRRTRQREAAAHVLRVAIEVLRSSP